MCVINCRWCSVLVETRDRREDGPPELGGGQCMSQLREMHLENGSKCVRMHSVLGIYLNYGTISLLWHG